MHGLKVQRCGHTLNQSQREKLAEYGVLVTGPRLEALSANAKLQKENENALSRGMKNEMQIKVLTAKLANNKQFQT